MCGALNSVNRPNHFEETSIFICAVALMAEADVEVMLSQADVLGADVREPFDRHTILLGK